MGDGLVVGVDDLLDHGCVAYNDTCSLNWRASRGSLWNSSSYTRRDQMQDHKGLTS